MSNAKTSTILNIIGNGIKIYVQNFFTLSAPVVAPVLAILAGIFLLLIPVYLLPIYYPVWVKSAPFLGELYAIIPIILLCLLPGLIVFKIGFWNYLIKMVSLNTMICDILKKKMPKHHSHYSQVVALRGKDFLLMLFIWCAIILMGLALPVSVFLFDIEPVFANFLFIGFEFIAAFLLVILSVYLSLSFQVFAFETSLGPMQTLEESFRLVLNNFWRLVFLIIVLSIITTVLVPQLFVFLFDILMIKSIIAFPVETALHNTFENYPNLYPILQSFPLFSYESLDKFVLESSKNITFGIISTIVSLCMLPTGSCLYTLFYIDVKKRKTVKEEPAEKSDNQEQKSKSKKSKKK